MYLRKNNLAFVVESQFSETFTRGLMGNRKISNIFGDYCILKTNGSKFPGETHPIAQISGYNTGVRHFSIKTHQTDILNFNSIFLK